MILPAYPSRTALVASLRDKKLPPMNTFVWRYSLEQMARSLVESGEYRVTSRLEPQAEYHPPDDSPKLVAADRTVRAGASTESSAPEHTERVPLGE